MAAMLIFTLVMDLTGWAVFTLTDLMLGGFSGVHMVMLAEWFVVPMAASAIYRAVTGSGKFSDAKEKTMYMLMWFVISTGISAVVCKAVETGRWFEDAAFTRFDYLTFASAFVLGFIVYSVAFEIVRFFVEGGFASRRTAGAK
ncbi:hypothetical protein [uncultured Ruminococcus sp.]|uniref:hypothetical protein n=1 Tax=uncultured Ruminococcus sp. TaxID=165186 RepID=UPI0025F69727|nr:hypothetical protein [uncultured Ruminococcus sp.]